MGLKHTIKRWLGIADLDQEVFELWQAKAMHGEQLTGHEKLLKKCSESMVEWHKYFTNLAQPTNEVTPKKRVNKSLVAAKKLPKKRKYVKSGKYAKKGK